ncbi:MAG: erythromycin esterase family protein [Bacteroidota bacterium]
MRRVLLFMILSCSAMFAHGQTESSLLITNKLVDLHDVWDSAYVSFPGLKETLEDAEIVMLGEQSHYDGTTLATKVKLVEFLHKEMGFDILAFESGFYDCNKAWSEIQKGGRVDLNLAKNVFSAWSAAKEFEPLADYISNARFSGHPLKVMGFDSQFTEQRSRSQFVDDLKHFLAEHDNAVLKTEEWERLETTLIYRIDNDFKKLRKLEITADTVFINAIISGLAESPQNDSAEFWMQALENSKVSLVKENSSFYRDRQMAQNLTWIKEKNPGKKIICWGATSHFLYNSQSLEMVDEEVQEVVGDYYSRIPSMGNYVKAEYGSKVYTIGFIAYEGMYGLKKDLELDTARTNSIEAIIGQASFDNCFLPLEGLELDGLISRPVGNQFMSTDISTVMDGVVFNRYMIPPNGNVPLIYEIHPDWIWLAPDEMSKKEIRRRKKEFKQGA